MVQKRDSQGFGTKKRRNIWWKLCCEKINLFKEGDVIYFGTIEKDVIIEHYLS